MNVDDARTALKEIQIRLFGQLMQRTHVCARERVRNKKSPALVQFVMSNGNTSTPPVE
jgi:hypothetical protein